MHRQTIAETPSRILESPSSSAAPAVSVGSLTDYLSHWLRVAQESQVQAFLSEAFSFLRYGTFTVLVILQENPGITQTALGAAIGRDKSTLTSTLDHLDELGLIRREKIPSNRRSYHLSLTPKGIEVLKKLKRHAANHDQRLESVIGSENREAFVLALKRIADHFSA